MLKISYACFLLKQKNVSISANAFVVQSTSVDFVHILEQMLHRLRHAVVWLLIKSRFCHDGYLLTDEPQKGKAAVEQHCC